MARLQFKRKCRVCQAKWVLVESRKPQLCEFCKKKLDNAER